MEEERQVKGVKSYRTRRGKRSRAVTKIKKRKRRCEEELHGGSQWAWRGRDPAEMWLMALNPCWRRSAAQRCQGCSKFKWGRHDKQKLMKTRPAVCLDSESTHLPSLRFSLFKEFMSKIQKCATRKATAMYCKFNEQQWACVFFPGFCLSGYIHAFLALLLVEKNNAEEGKSAKNFYPTTNTVTVL